MLLRKIKRNIENRLGIQIHKMRHGLVEWADIKASGCHINTIFDVGANIGQSALKFREAFPKSLIYCFEPVSSIFRELKATVSGDSNINCYSLAFSCNPGNGTIYLAQGATQNSFIPMPDTIGTESVSVKTVDNFASENCIERIDLLKIDTEGHDLEVLKGASHMLSGGRTAFVLAEVGFNPMDNRHVLFDDVRSLLMEKGFSLFGIYDQELEWTGEQRIRFANVCFSNEEAFRKI